MKVTFNWLRDFINIRLSPEALAEKLTMAGLEVTSLEHKEGEVIFEIEITPNRSDLLCVFGIAREVAAITGKKLKFATGHRPQATGKSLQLAACSLQLEIEDKKDCPLYTAKIIRDVKVGPSPEWLQKRLELIGCRSINNIVDITNYCLFAWGEPLHAFDLDKLNQNTIIVRRAKVHEKITTIDGQLRTLNPDILVIADSNSAVAVAGIMGGKDTEVTDSTKNILLEAAVFSPVIIRHGRQRLGIQTDSSYRFERAIDLQTAEYGSWQAVQLMQDLAKGSCVAAKSKGVSKAKNKVVNLNLSSMHKILNMDITPGEAKSILHSLGFITQKKSKNHFSVVIPSQRPDVNLEIDLLEEIARIFGYERIPKSLPRVLPEPGIGEKRDLVALTKNILVGLGLNEVITYSLVDKDLLNKLGVTQEQNAIEILNPLSKEQEILRPTILPSLASCVAYNLNQKQDYVNIFEVAQVFLQERDVPREELVLGIALCGSKSLLLQQGLIKDAANFLHLKGILEALFQRLGIAEYSFTPHQSGAGLTSSGQAMTRDIYVRKQKIGFMMMLSQGTLDKFDIKHNDVFLLELSLEKLFSHALLQKKFIPPPKYPGITRDISFILKQGISIKDILDELQEMGLPMLRDIKVVDYYKGKQIPPGYRGLTISCLYRSDDKTLTEAEINPLHSLLCNTLTERFAVKIR